LFFFVWRLDLKERKIPSPYLESKHEFLGCADASRGIVANTLTRTSRKKKEAQIILLAHFEAGKQFLALFSVII